jgi:hypothetical protein
MPLFTMAKKTPKIADSESGDSSAQDTQRPGTSGTELLLTTNRRTASAQYQAAQRAEQAYKAKKRSAGAKQHRSDAKVHFKQSAMHFKEGLKSTWAIFAAVPWMLRGWREKKQAATEKKNRERDLEKKKKLEEKLSKQAEMEKKEGEGEAA